MSLNFSWIEKKDGDSIFAEHVNDLADGIKESQKSLRSFGDIPAFVTKANETSMIARRVATDVSALADEVGNISSELNNKPEKSDIPTKVSELENDAEYVTKETLTETTLIAGEAFTKAEEAKTIATHNAEKLNSKVDMDLLHYYEEPATPTDDSLFNFVVYDGITEAAIDSVDTNISGDIVIPYECEVNGSIYKVGFIGDGTFDRSGITGVVIPNTVTYIGDNAFLGCEYLKKVVIPDTVTYIGKGAFAGCKYLTVKCNADSNAETYCKNAGVNYVLDTVNKVSQLKNDADYVTGNQMSDTTKGLYDFIMKDINALREDKADKPTLSTSETTALIYDFAERDNNVAREGELESVSFVFTNDAYDELFISELTFDSGDTPTVVDFPYEDNEVIINWYGTDCAIQEWTDDEGNHNIAPIFQPSANTRYNIMFWFDGADLVGKVHGYVPANRNVVS